MIGFESELTGETAVTAITKAHELFSGDMTPARIRDVVEKFEKESGGYKEIDAYYSESGETIYKSVVAIVNSNARAYIHPVLQGTNLQTLLNINGFATGFHRIKIKEGAVFTGYEGLDNSILRISPHKDLYLDITIAEDSFYGEFLIPGIIKGVFTFEYNISSILIKSILCPQPAYLGIIRYSKLAGDMRVKYDVDFNFFSDTLLLYPYGFRSSYRDYENAVNGDSIHIGVEFYIAESGGLTAILTYSNDMGLGSFTLVHSAPYPYVESFYLGTTAYQGSQFSGSFRVYAPDGISTLADSLPFCSDKTFINRGS